MVRNHSSLRDAQAGTIDATLESPTIHAIYSGIRVLLR
jgi:hypothetical protein